MDTYIIPAVNTSLAEAIEIAFRSQGRPAVPPGGTLWHGLSEEALQPLLHNCHTTTAVCHTIM